MKRTILTLLSIPVLAMSLAAAPAMADDWRHGPPGPGAGPGGPGPGPGGPRGWADRHDERRDRHDRRDAYRDGYRDGRYSRPVVVERNYYSGGYYRPGPPPPPVYYRPPPPPVAYYRPYGYERGYRYVNYYSGRPIVVNDYDYYGVRRPPPGYHWIRDDRGNLIMVAIATGIITDLLLNR
ncbi:RcnB family protein [Pseudoxanthomonas winnipegensis]|nr:RcnB family protein [Pseudoxanthomonas winnipegensis]